MTLSQRDRSCFSRSCFPIGRFLTRALTARGVDYTIHLRPSPPPLPPLVSRFTTRWREGNCFSGARAIFHSRSSSREKCARPLRQPEYYHSGGIAGVAAIIWHGSATTAEAGRAIKLQRSICPPRDTLGLALRSGLQSENQRRPKSNLFVRACDYAGSGPLISALLISRYVTRSLSGVYLKRLRGAAVQLSTVPGQ